MGRTGLLRAATVVAALLVSGCGVRAGYHARAELGPPIVFEEPPTLVAVGPDVWVVGDYPAAVYYVDGYYYHRSGDYWYRASSWDDRSWIRVNVGIVPRTIIGRPHYRYVNYRAHGRARVRVAPGAHHRVDRRISPRDRVRTHAPGRVRRADPWDRQRVRGHDRDDIRRSDDRRRRAVPPRRPRFDRDDRRGPHRDRGHHRDDRRRDRRRR